MGIFRFSADKRILRDHQHNPEASWSNFLAPDAKIIPRPTSPKPPGFYLSLTWNHIWAVLLHSHKGKVVYVNPYFIFIFGLCIVNFWEIQSQFWQVKRTQNAKQAAVWESW